MTGNIKQLTALWALLFMVCVQAVYGADIRISSVVSPTKVSVNDRLQLTVTVEGSDARKTGTPVFKSMPDFSIAGPSVMDSFSWVNGVTSYTKTYTYSLIPKKTGTFEVGAVAVSDGSNNYSAPATRVEVVGTRVEETPVPEQTDENIFIRTEVDKTQPYVGEQVTLTFELYNRLTLWGDTEYEPPATTGFWAVELPKIPPATKVAGNRMFQYNAIKTALFPTTSGELTIGPASLSYSTGGFFSSQRSQVLKSKPITLRVKPLPEQGKPDTFTGAVGNYEISISADKTTVKANDVVTVTVTVAGRGNLDLVSAITPPDLSSFKSYDPKVSNSISNSGFIIGGGKTWEYILMPKFQGNISIEPFSLSFFDPEDHSYHTVSTQAIALKVTPGNPEAAGAVSGGDQRNSIDNIARDIRYIKPDKVILNNTRKQLYTNMVFYCIYFLPFTFFVAALVLKKRRDTIERNTGLKRRLKSWKKAQKKLEEASHKMNKGETAAYYGALSESITDYIGDCLNIDTGSLTTAALNEILRKNAVDPDMAEHIGKTLELCDFFRFSSSGSGHEMQQKLLEDTRTILARLREVI
ncbi:BatD family protein [bacterium]|nr:BatD family protein [bacterium]